MPTWVFYQGRLIDKRYKPASAASHALSDLPAPAVVRFEAFASPVDGRPIRSRREHDRDLDANGCYDPRDTPAAFRKARDVRQQQQRHRITPTEP